MFENVEIVEKVELVEKVERIGSLKVEHIFQMPLSPQAHKSFTLIRG
jgi:hypothetical protein